MRTRFCSHVILEMRSRALLPPEDRNGGRGRDWRVYKEVFAKVSLHYRKTLIRKKVGPLFERVRLLFTHTSAPLEEPATRFNGARLEQMRDDVYVFMHQIGPRQ